MIDLIYNKSEIIEKCIKRIREEYENNKENLNNCTKQDSIILNIQRACEACIDLAMYIVSIKRFGIPQNSRDVFDMLEENHILDKDLAKKFKSMVGFRNIVVHNYEVINVDIIDGIINNNLEDMIKFKDIIINEYC
ncbi:MAG: DUF86 domain-containing protein [Anaeromicrobium sp.]|jgi:uncharacterized protein YutE (UPF0331/DUF86 family)|uniref:type VII toxin-antitoxin system HepT family RNase toxin n=1 Tax=Anaeromicrobium sp. TaxID=1929132 RepID=UPI0025F3F4E2|nr:DUF86 domain-containing protein [Anaeromicrobium sp.]MCT4594630.1 DUF86 domain-containing protein [Anaeromicrobium sp.]